MRLRLQYVPLTPVSGESLVSPLFCYLKIDTSISILIKYSEQLIQKLFSRLTLDTWTYEKCCFYAVLVLFIVCFVYVLQNILLYRNQNSELTQIFCVVNLRIKHWSSSYADLRINLIPVVVISCKDLGFKINDSPRKSSGLWFY